MLIPFAMVAVHTSFNVCPRPRYFVHRSFEEESRELCYHRLVILEFILLSVQIWTLVKTQVRGQFIGIRIGIVDNSNPQNSVTSSSSDTNERHPIQAGMNGSPAHRRRKQNEDSRTSRISNSVPLLATQAL